MIGRVENLPNKYFFPFVIFHCKDIRTMHLDQESVSSKIRGYSIVLSANPNKMLLCLFYGKSKPVTSQKYSLIIMYDVSSCHHHSCALVLMSDWTRALLDWIVVVTRICI